MARDVAPHTNAACQHKIKTQAYTLHNVLTAWVATWHAKAPKRVATPGGLSDMGRHATTQR